HYRFSTPENDPTYKRYCGRVLDTNTILYDDKWKSHVYLDIFCWDNAPDDDKALKKIIDHRNFLWYFYRLQFRSLISVPQGNIFRKTGVFVLCALMKILTSFIIPKNYFAKKMNFNARKYMYQNTKRVGNFLGLQLIAVDRKLFEKFIDAEFEGKMYKIPAGYDELLCSLYGDYMQLPPEEERVPNHHFEAYIKD
ncbi:MAG: LicD family protein, partial [Synergistaceae bacterium]|nr:LicD family protein [Synergistaceae bacterium]